MRERVHISLITCSDYIEHIHRTLKSIESSIASLQGQLQEVQQLVSLLSDLESDQSVEEAGSKATVYAPVAESTTQPQPLVTQPIQQAVRLSNHEQLALAQQRVRDWAA